jgi:hypothetical protein
MYDKTATNFGMDLLKYVTEFHFGGLGVVVLL